MERFDGELPMLYATDAQGRLRFVDDVKNGLACGCTCPACGQALVARNGGTKLIHHFAHRTNACAWAIEAIVSRIAAESLKEAGRIRLPGLSYHDAVEDERIAISVARTMAIDEVGERAVSGRGVPDIFVTVRAKSSTRTFAVVCSLTHRVTEEQVANLMGACAGVIVYDLARDLRRRRKELGKHYDRVEALRAYQDRTLVAEALGKTGDLVVWAANERAATLERLSVEKRRAIDEQRAQERAEREARKAAEAAERAREHAERERLRLEEQQAAKERDRRERELLESQDKRRAVEEVTRRVEMRRDECLLDPAYDVRTWPQLARLSGGSLVCFGGLKAFMSVTATGSRHTILCDLRPYEAHEVAWHLQELQGDADELTVVFVAEAAHERGDIVATFTDEGEIRCEARTSQLIDAFDALEAILDANVPVSVNLAAGAGGRLLEVMGARRLFVLASRKRPAAS